MKATLAGIAAFVVVIGAVLALSFGGQEIAGWLGFRKANIEHRNFKQGRAFNEGMIQELAKLKLEYAREDNEVAKKAIAASVRHKTADMDRSKLPAELLSFVQECAGY